MVRDIEPNGVFGNRYRLLALIGASSCARVFTADDLVLKRRVAVKIFDEELAADDAFVERFQESAATAVALSHTHVLTTYEWGSEPLCHLVTEYVDGGSLRAMINAGLLLSRAQALVVGLEAARALEHIHSKGLTHLGVNPSNLLFDTDGRLYLADFGMAAALSSMGRKASSTYVAPEQSQGEPATLATDVYCLALSLGEAITGIDPSHTTEASESTESDPNDTEFTDPEGAEVHDTPYPRVSGPFSDGMESLMSHTDTPFGHSSALGPLWYAVGRAIEPLPADRPSATKLAKDLLGVAELLSRPESLPLVGVEPMDLPVQSDASADNSHAQQDSRHEPSHDPYELVESGSPPEQQSTSPYEKPVKQKRTTKTSPDSTGDGRGLEWKSAASTGPTLSKSVSQMSRLPGIPPDDLPRRRWTSTVLSLTVVLSSAVGVGWAWWNSRVEVHSVPDFLGMERTEAADAATEMSWEVENILVRSSGTRLDEVVATEPVPGTRLATGETLTLFVSLGEPLVAAPDIYALPIEEATTTVDALGLNIIGSTQVNHEQVPDGFVVGLDFPEGVYELEIGTGVNLLISSGPADVPVPPVPPDRSVHTAAQTLLAARFVPVQVEERSRDIPEGSVISFSPPSGTVAEPGTVVEMLVSQGASQVEIPPVLGQDLSVVVSLLEAVGFDVVVDGSYRLPVTSIFPAPGEIAPYGARVVVSTDD